MFTKKKESLSGFDNNTSGNIAIINQPFLAAGLEKSAETSSGNGSLKYSTTGYAELDQFGKTSTYRKPRTFDEISRDMSILWAENQLNAVKFTIYLRLISRKVMMFDVATTEAPQRGAELKHEAQMRMFWILQKSSETFYKNLPVFISAGSWKDIFVLMKYDLEYHGWEEKVLDFNRVVNLIISGLNDPNHVDLIKKYLPSLKSKSNCTTVGSQANNLIAKYICNKLFGQSENMGKTYREYRKLKSSGTAHEWQQLISQKKHNLIDFSKIHGRALSQLVKSKYLKNQGLSEKYNEWITKPETVGVKYTGFVHELFKDCILGNSNSVETINKQFKTLVEKAGPSQTNLIVVRDTSASMGSYATGLDISCFDVAKSLALYFSEFLSGQFANSYIEFNSSAKMCTWKGSTPVERWVNDKAYYNGSTNFQSVIELFCNLRSKGISESDFPSGILCISDGMFNPAELDETNVESARRKLTNAGFSEQYVRDFVIILWNLGNDYYGSKKSGQQFETYGNVSNTYHFSGYSASVIAMLREGIKTPMELFDACMNQELLQKVEV